MSLIRFVVILLCSWILTAPPEMAQAITRTGIYPLSSIDAQSDDTDLKPLETLIGNATLVGLGESVHASEGFSKVKLRIIPYLVKHLGFRVIGWETAWGKARQVNEYILTCKGSPQDALKGVYDLWESQAVAELFKWLCHYNSEHPDDPVRFFGFDPLFETAASLEVIQRALLLIDPEKAELIASTLSTCFGFGISDHVEIRSQMEKIFLGSRPPVSDADHLSCVAAIAEIRKLLAANDEEMLGTPTSIRDWALVGLTSLESFQHNVYQLTRDHKLEYEARNRGMAELFSHIRSLIAPHQKTVIWAHNDHLAKKHSTIALPGFMAGVIDMGEILSARFGAEYAAIGITGYSIGIHWPGRMPQELALPQFNSFEGVLHETVKHALVDANSNLFAPGQSYEFGIWERLIPADQFTGVIFLDRSEPMKKPQPVHYKVD